MLFLESTLRNLCRAFISGVTTVLMVLILISTESALSIGAGAMLGVNAVAVLILSCTVSFFLTALPPSDVLVKDLSSWDSVLPDGLIITLSIFAMYTSNKSVDTAARGADEVGVAVHILSNIALPVLVVTGALVSRTIAERRLIATSQTQLVVIGYSVLAAMWITVCSLVWHWGNELIALICGDDDCAQAVWQTWTGTVCICCALFTVVDSSYLASVELFQGEIRTVGDATVATRMTWRFGVHSVVWATGRHVALNVA
jgi:hypothetical protein